MTNYFFKFVVAHSLLLLFYSQSGFAAACVAVYSNDLRECHQKTTEESCLTTSADLSRNALPVRGPKPGCEWKEDAPSNCSEPDNSDEGAACSKMTEASCGSKKVNSIYNEYDKFNRPTGPKQVNCVLKSCHAQNPTYEHVCINLPRTNCNQNTKCKWEQNIMKSAAASGRTTTT